jgi:hypothetical protein
MISMKLKNAPAPRTPVPERGQDTTLEKRHRRIGRRGTVARLLAGVALLGDVAYGHWTRGFHPAAWALGLIGFSAVLITAQWLRARHHPAALRATGPIGHAVNAAVFLALYLTPLYVPALSVTSDATLIFYGASMLLAAARGDAGCEALAVSNWLLNRDDQVGCLLFGPIDHLDAPAGKRPC